MTVRIRDLLASDRGTIFVVDHARQLLWSKVAHHAGTAPVHILITLLRGIAGHVVRTGTSINNPDA